MSRQRWLLGMLALFITAAIRSQPVPTQKLVTIWDGQVTVIESGAAVRLTNSPHTKSTPVWSQDGSDIAFLEDTAPNQHLPDLVVIDGKGTVLMRKAFFPNFAPGESVRAIVPRSIALDGYVNQRELLVEGSLNRWVCDFLFVEVQSGEITRETLGQCGSLSLSPDGKHVLTESNLRANAANDWRDGLAMDSETLYPVGALNMRFLSVPVWSPDGKLIAVAERNVITGERDLTIVDTHEGSALHSSLPRTFGGVITDETDDSRPARLAWDAGQVVVTDGKLTFQSRPGETVAQEVHASRGSVLDKLEEQRAGAAAIRRTALSAAGISGALEAVYDVWPAVPGTATSGGSKADR